MIPCFHEKSNLNVNASGSKQRAFIDHGTANPGSPYGDKDRGSLLILEGQRPGWIADVLGLTRQSLNLWMHRVNDRGLMALAPVKQPGRPPRLTLKVQQRLEEDLEKPPSEFGLSRVRWDGPTLVVHLKRQFGITLKVRQAQSWMHQLGYRLKRAGYTYLQGKGEEARRFRRALKKTPGAESEGNDSF
jgi:transposase